MTSNASGVEVQANVALSLGGPLTVVDYHRLAREIARGEGGRLDPIRVSLLSTFTFEFVRPFLLVEGARLGLRVTPLFGPFGQIEQQITAERSALYESRPDALVLALRPEDVAPDAVARPFAGGEPSLRTVLHDLIERIARCMEQFRVRSSTPVLVANFAEPATMPLGPFDANVRESLTYALADANAAVRERLTAFANVAVWDLAGLVRSRGTTQWVDRRLWALARVPVAQHHQPALAAHLVRSLSALFRPPAKCLVLDLDNTLWGGVIGDDGLTGIQVGDDFPGNVFKDFQRRVLGLMDRGVLLAVVSKNDPEVVAEVFHKHPDMLIKWDDLAATRINWDPKSQSIRQVAAELNIGSDQVALFDDNAVEQAEVRMNAPEVLVVDVPPDPLGYAEALASVPWFDQVTLSEEDQKRTAMYRQQRQRSEAERQFVTLEDFLASLEMTAEVGEVSEATMGRVAQLIGKTNQFNLTTRRHSSSEIAAMAADPNHVVAWLRLADRFGDQGLVAVGILRREGERGGIDTLVMSCRVMNRHVERALMAYLVEHARRLGCRDLVGEYLPTRKNGLVRDLYPTLGFAPQDQEGHWFVLDLQVATVEWPPAIRREGAGASGREAD